MTVRLRKSVFFMSFLTFFAHLVTSCGEATMESSPSAVLTYSQNVIENTFQKHYFERYSAGRCGENVLDFVSALHKKNVKLNSFKVAQITNVGLSVFGMVNAEVARDWLHNQPAEVEKNWYHHVVLFDSKTHIIYDFDYKIKPTPAHLTDYVEGMFLNEPECEKRVPGEHGFCGGRDSKLDGYLWELTSAADHLAVRNPQNSKKLSMRKLLAEIGADSE